MLLALKTSTESMLTSKRLKANDNGYILGQFGKKDARKLPMQKVAGSNPGEVKDSSTIQCY